MIGGKPVARELPRQQVLFRDDALVRVGVPGQIDHPHRLPQHSATANDGLRLRMSVADRTVPSSVTSFRSSAAPRDVVHAPDRSEIDTLSDTLRSGRPCDSWTPLEAKVREFLSKTHRCTPLDAGGKAETDLVVRVSLVRS